MSIITNLLGRYPLISNQVNRQQLQVLLEELSLVVDHKVEGAVVEFGCYIGTSSVFMRRLLDQLKDERPFHVYDSFVGLPPKTAPDQSPSGEQFKAGELRVSRKQFNQVFQKANLRLPIVHKAWFSDLTDQDVPDKIAFAFLDGDFYESIRDSLKLVLPRLRPGATIIFDDYSREALPGVALAVRDLLSPDQLAKLVVKHNFGILHL